MSPLASPCVSEREKTFHHVLQPTARIVAALVVLMTGMGIAAVFWKMPNGAATHALCGEGIMDKNLAMAPLPSEATAMISPEEGDQMALPTLDMVPVTASGAVQYGQIYPLPASLAVLNSEQEKTSLSAVEEESALVPVVPQTKFEPMRKISEETPISVESVDREFLPKPVSVSTAEKMDELLTAFHFAANERAVFDDGAEAQQPADPFPVAATATSGLQPLKPIRSGGLVPLTPLQSSELHPLPVLVAQ